MKSHVPPTSQLILAQVAVALGMLGLLPLFLAFGFTLTIFIVLIMFMGILYYKERVRFSLKSLFLAAECPRPRRQSP